MEGQAQHDKIEQFTVLLKMCKGPGVEDAVQKALAATGLFVFGELVCLPTMQKVTTSTDTQSWFDLHGCLRPLRYGTIILRCLLVQLKGSDHEVALNTLELFAYGTWADYKGVPLRLLYPCQFSLDDRCCS